MKRALKQLLNTFDKLVDEGHEEILDTVVREAMAAVICRSLVDPTPGYSLPDSFGMFSAKGDRKVKAALVKFLAHSETVRAKKLPTPKDRLDTFQDSEVESDGGNSYDEYFGYNDGTYVPQPVIVKVAKKSGKSKRGKLQPGEIVAIALDEKTCGFAKVYKDLGLGVYAFTGPASTACDQVVGYPFLFHCLYFSKDSSEWPVIGKQPFESAEDAECPPMYHRDVISGRLEIRHRNKSRPATEKEVKGLSEEIFYSSEGLRRRIKEELAKAKSKIGNSKRQTRPSVGDIVEIPLAKGFVYAHFVNSYKQPPRYGPLLKIFTTIHRMRPTLVTAVIEDGEHYFTFFPVVQAVRARLVIVVGRKAIPNEQQPRPVFRGYNTNADGKITSRFIIDEKGDHRVEKWTKQQLELSLQEWPSFPVLVERLESGWHPRVVK